MKNANRYGVQIKVNGVWGWAGVIAPAGMPYLKAHASMRLMKTEPFWTDRVKAEAFRVFEVGFTTKGISI